MSDPMPLIPSATPARDSGTPWSCMMVGANANTVSTVPKTVQKANQSRRVCKASPPAEEAAHSHARARGAALHEAGAPEL